METSTGDCTMKRLCVLWFALAVALTASPSFMCAADSDKVGSTRFIAYEGKQDWPTGEGASVIKDYAVPIYLGLPPKGYKVLGRIEDKRTEGVDVVGKA